MATVSRRPARLDLAPAGVVAVIVVAGTVAATAAQAGRSHPLDVAGLALLVTAAVVTTLPRRTNPALALAGAVVVVNGYVLAGYPFGPVLLCLAIAVFELARQRTLAVSAALCAPAAAVSSVVLLVRVVGEPHNAALMALAWAGWIVLPWSLGALVHVIAASRRELAARAALEERMRIAAEVHDVAGHGFALVTMQAGVALLVFDEEPDQARRCLAAVRDTAATALADLRGMLDTFHAAPALTQLLDRVRAAGLPVDAHVTAPLSATGCRVVQEALTNVLRHAGPTTAEVEVSHHQEGVLVRVSDRGRGGTASQGRGLTGMRRRVEGVGGTLRAGPRPGGGFEVAAWLPA